MKFYHICFSPTGGTKKASAILINALADSSEFIDLTDSRTDFSAFRLSKDSIAVISVPSYGGRVPAIACQRLSEICGGNARAVLLCVYGNRAYEDTLSELSDTAKNAGFKVIAAAAAIAEHSIFREFAAGRPDADDEKTLKGFAEKITEKINSSDFSEPEIPGNRPYKKAFHVGLVPQPSKACVRCGTCAKACPVQAIDAKDPEKVDEKICISCMRCISVCPKGARSLDPAALAALRSSLEKACAGRRNNELFL